MSLLDKILGRKSTREIELEELHDLDIIVKDMETLMRQVRSLTKDVKLLEQEIEILKERQEDLYK